MADKRCSFQVCVPIDELTAVSIFGAASLCRLRGGGARQHLHQPFTFEDMIAAVSEGRDGKEIV